MATTISDGTTTITPHLVRGYRSSRMARNVINEIINNAAPSVSLRPAGLRTGTLEIIVDTMADAFTLEALLAQAKSFTLTVSTATARSMRFVASGEITLDLDRETNAKWVVTCEFQEIPT